jgi:hypothetical protein
MRGFIRYRILLLALVLAVANMVLLSHAAAHFHPQLEECELCVSELQPQATVPPTPACFGQAASPARLATATRQAVLFSKFRHDHLQRAPPSLSPRA